MPQTSPKAKRPTGVTVLTVLYVLAALFIFYFASTLWSPMSVGPLTNSVPGTAFYVGVGILTLAMAWGYLKGAKWSWWLSLAMIVIEIVLNGINFVSVMGEGLGAPGNSIIANVVLIGVLLIMFGYLMMPNAKRWFGFKS
jgi:hypothetical protein